MKDKPQDIMDSNNIETDIPKQTEAQTRLAERVQTLLRGSFDAKEQMDLMNNWAMYDDYKHGRQNAPQSPEHPGSVTNIIHPIIEGQISDLTDKPFSTVAEGREPGDHLYSDDVQHAMDFVLEKNQFPVKLDISEHDRTELGTTIIKVYYDSEALDGKGLPSFEIISPPNFFPDPKWTAAHLLQDGEFNAHAVPRPLSFIRRKYPKWGKYVVRETTFPFDPTLDIPTTRTDEVDVDVSQKALLIEAYLKDANGELYSVTVANHIVLEDSREVLKGQLDAEGKPKKLQRRNQFPFVAIPCYPQRGTGWGQGDVELLIPTQDLINDLDDQIRMNARMMGNPQIVVGQGAGKGFDNRKWTNKAGLRIPMRDPHAWSVVPAVPVSRDVPVRREKAFEEANIISGRPDVNRGEAPGQVTAAAAILALQQAGQKTVLHKAKMWKQGWSLVLGLLYDEMIDNWDEPMWVRINGNELDYKFIDPTKLRQAPVMVPNLTGEGDYLKPLMDTVPMMQGEQQMLDEMGQPMMQMEPMTRNAEFDLSLNIGDGLPSDKTFIYQTMVEMSNKMIEGKPVVTWQEFRDYLRDQVGMQLGNDESVMAPTQPGMPQLPQGGAPIAG